jgi:hypothetical protein
MRNSVLTVKNGEFMEVCIAVMHGREIMFGLRDGQAWLDGEFAPIKNVALEELERFQADLDNIPKQGDPDGLRALVNARRAAFIVNLLGRAADEDCISELTHILDHVHWDVQEYLNA